MASAGIFQLKPQPRLLRVLLNYSRGDKGTVRKLYRKLRRDGFMPWLDDEEIVPGVRWEDAIQDAVRNADAVII